MKADSWILAAGGMRLAMRGSRRARRVLQEVAMKVNHSIGKLAVGIAAALALGSAFPAAAQDDSALFSASVPPNVLMVVDNSGSMNEIMWHPNLDSSASTCAMFGWVAPGVNGPANTPYPSSVNGTLADQSSNNTPYICDPNTRHCRFEIHEAVAGFTQTGTTTCANSNPCG